VYGTQAEIDRSWRKVTRFQMHSVSDHYGIAERQSWFGAVPVNEFVDGMPITALGIGARKAVHDRCFRHFQARESHYRLRLAGLPLCWASSS
jgi:hypothetical protein